MTSNTPTPDPLQEFDRLLLVWLQSTWEWESWDDDMSRAAHDSSRDALREFVKSLIGDCERLDWLQRQEMTWMPINQVHELTLFVKDDQSVREAIDAARQSTPKTAET